MLPDLRAAVAAVIASLGLMMIAFGAVATFRVAQDNHVGSLQADLAKRGRAEPPASAQRPVLIIDTPGPTVLRTTAPTPPPEASAPPEPAAPPETAASVETPAPVVTAAEPPAEPPAATSAIGGPSPEQMSAEAETVRQAAKKKAEARRAAKKARDARIARERKAAARRAALARAKRQSAAPSATSFNSGLGNSGFGIPGPTQ